MTASGNGFLFVFFSFIEIILKFIETAQCVFSHLLGVCLVTADQNKVLSGLVCLPGEMQDYLHKLCAVISFPCD